MESRELNLFPSDEIQDRVRVRKASIFADYDSFVEKFKPKKTTDDCYTPESVYRCVVDYVSRLTDLSGRAVVRPFYPGGDYKRFDYPDNAIVIDNPPFSIYSEIVRYYLRVGIEFFLFAPHLTLFNDMDCTFYVIGADVVYENGATVKTSFVTNIPSGNRIVVDADFRKALEAASKKDKKDRSQKKRLPKYQYSDNITTSALLGRLTKNQRFAIRKDECLYVRNLDALKAIGKSLFGGGFLLTEKAAAEKAAAEKAAAEKAAAEKAAAEKAIIIDLSERERKKIEKKK
ncbi:hypothetical protein [Prevotella sp. KH2C16]|uniref:hypothetical protein n=1 Tax=Prevotella sp. KH2C16 TaxID=1855325 RepID=UPI0008E2CF0D|nr:hypothetical protein [Prevotella sp. KH2C16]SFG13028.1 hypothetical protein SAMN05216383_105183 [Prevotella sp. KH2C16]